MIASLYSSLVTSSLEVLLRLLSTSITISIESSSSTSFIEVTRNISYIFLLIKSMALEPILSSTAKYSFFPSTEYNFKGLIHVLTTIGDNPCSVSRRESISSHFDKINSSILPKILSVQSLCLWSYRHRTTYLYLITK